MSLSYADIPSPVREEAIKLGRRRIRALGWQVSSWLLRRLDGSRVVEILMEEGVSRELSEWLVERASRRREEAPDVDTEQILRDEIRSIMQPRTLADVFAKGALRGAILLLLIAVYVALGTKDGFAYRFFATLVVWTMAFLAMSMLSWFRELREEIEDRQARRRIGKG
ncbi:MAG: hypothetical protein U0S12_12880 [Fimbriimonadales bacterium]